MSLEDTLKSWTGPSSDTEQEKQERTERMVRDAMTNHPAFRGSRFTVYTKGSYANSTNVRVESDVDVAVQCHEVEYWREDQKGTHASNGSYTGPWTPEKLRREVGAALRTKFPNQVDDSGSTAFTVRSSSARVDADVVPCFDFRYYFAAGTTRVGTRIVTKNGEHFENYPAQQLEHGRAKNKRTKTYYKQGVRILKRVENAMHDAGVHREVPSFFMECLGYNCPDSIFQLPSWTETVRRALSHIWTDLQGTEPQAASMRWIEANECKYLFSGQQVWKRADGRDFAKAAWNYLGYKS
jgi:hypothetical protein